MLKNLITDKTYTEKMRLNYESLHKRKDIHVHRLEDSTLGKCQLSPNYSIGSIKIPNIVFTLNYSVCVCLSICMCVWNLTP